MTTCFNFIRCVASATRIGSSSSSANGLAVVTAQNPQARVQRSPAIMNVAVPLLQHSQWFGHLALSQTVCSLSLSSNVRVCAKESDVGNWKRSHSGRRGRGFNSVTVISTTDKHKWTQMKSRSREFHEMEHNRETGVVPVRQKLK